MNERAPRLILPGEFTDPSGIVRVRPDEATLRPREQALVAGMVNVPAVVAMTRPPSFDDQLHVYATHQELYRFILGSDLAGMLDIRPVTTADVIDWISGLPFEPAMRFAASLQKALSLAPVDPDWQRHLMRQVYLDSPIAEAGERFLRLNERGAIFSEQQLFALQRLLVLHAADEDAATLTRDQGVALRLALFYVPGTVLQADEDLGQEAPANVEDERWLRYFVGNGGLVAHGWLKHDIARAHRLYEVIAKSRRARRHVDFCDLDGWLREEYEFSFAELQAVGFVLLSGSRTLSDDEPPLAVTPDFYAPVAFADRLEHGFRALAADRDWYRADFERSGEHPRRAAFEIQPFLRRPGLRLKDGNVLVVAPRAIAGWLSATGAYYRFFDLARSKGSATRKRFTRFNGFLQESYARHLAHVAYPCPQGRSIGVGCVYGEKLYTVKRQERRTTDVVLDLGTDLVLVEVTAERVTQKSLVEADAQSVVDDIQMMIVDKMRQLGRVIRDVYADPERLPDIELAYVHRIWPVIVVSEGLFHNPSIWAYTQKQGGRYLEIPRTIVPAAIKPLTMVDLEELELLLGAVAAGHSLTAMLERKTSELWRERDLKAWLSGEYGHRWSGDAEFVSQEQGRAFDAVKRALGMENGRLNAADGGRQAA